MAKLRGIKPEEIKPKLKLFLYGEWKVGKTTAAISFSKPYLYDLEGGSQHKQYTEKLKKEGGLYFSPKDYDEVLDETKALATQKHEYKTLIIDPLTVLYNDMLDKSATRLANANDESGTAFGRHKAMPDRQMKRLFNWLTKLDMNVIITSHAKPNWLKDGEKLIEAGNTFDCYNKSPYLFDLILELSKRGKERWATIKGTRLEYFPDGESFKFSYDEIKHRYEQEYGEGALDKDAVPIELANQEQLIEINRLLSLLKDGIELKEAIIDKAKVETLEELNSEQANNIIKFLQSKIQGV